MPHSPCLPAGRTPPHCALFRALALAFLTLVGAHTHAQTSALVPAVASLHRQIERFVRDQSAHLPGDVKVVVALPEHTALPECPAFSLSTPSGARTLGRSSVAVRCPALVGSWRLLVPVQIQVIAPYVVTARAIPAGQVLGPDDLSTRTGDLGTLPAGTLTQPEQALGHVTRTALAGAQALRPALLKVVEVVRSGQSVTVLAGGAGFEVRNTGMALNSGGAGSLIRVRLANGQVVNGVATDRGEVRLGS
ncbi:MAG: flagellar basal body P-ring formation protein FlgA [Rhodocyclaceae bacterium]|nr:flagellar basal body P-ring formation protein FlgA [Rhodocyclaceae bacterium]